MSKPDHKSLQKEAKNELESFKKLYKTVCGTDTVTSFESMEALNNHWRSKLLSMQVKKEIIRLVENESMEMKLLFNLMYGFKYPIPQKRWFLGSAHSTALIRRQPCNAPVYAFYNFQSGFLTIFDQFHTVLNHEAEGAEVRIALDDQKFYIVFTTATKQTRLKIISDDDKISISTNDTPKPFENIVPIKEYDAGPNKTWKGKQMELRDDGKIYLNDNPVSIYLDGQKIENQKIVQWDVRNCWNDDFDVILLFETHFLAVGFMKEGKSGMLFECTEVGNSYPTSKFFISPGWKIVIRASVSVETKPICRVVPDYDRLKKAYLDMVNFCKARPEWTRHTEMLTYGHIMEAWRKNALNVFCVDFYLFSSAIGNTDNYNPSLSAKENIIRSVLQAKRNPEKNACCNESKTCSNLINFLNLMERVLKDLDQVKHTDDFKEISVIATHMFEMFVRMFKYQLRADFWENDIARIKEGGAYREYERLALAPLEKYEKNNEPSSMGTGLETFSKASLMNNFLNSQTQHVAAELLLRSPDVLLFDVSLIPIPVALIKKYCEVFPKLGTTEFSPLDPDEALIEYVSKFQDAPVPVEQQEKKNGKNSKSKKSEKKK